MNNQYRLVWNEKIQSWVPVAEIVRSRGKRNSGRLGDKSTGLLKRCTSHLSRLAVALALSLSGYTVYANPTGGQVVAGAASISTAPSQVTVNQSTNKAIINWQSFSINEGETTRFNQPSTKSIALNRIQGQDPSKIRGNLSANGQVWLVNPNGVYFGPNAKVDVSGLLATTHDIANDKFMAGDYQFNIPGKANASIVNEGSITINNAGLAAFVAPAVRNDGVIVAKLGQVEMASGTGFSLDLYGDQLVELAVDPQTVQAYTTGGEPIQSFVENSGKIEAETVVMTANAARDVVDNVINMSGEIHATTATQSGGTIIIGGDPSHGDINVSGTLDASATNETQAADGGEIIVYGDNTTIASTAVIKAEGGQAGGDGGFIETSGNNIVIENGITIGTNSEKGVSGTWLIDPTDFTITADSSALSGSGIGAVTLQEQLALGGVTIQTTGTVGTEDGDIIIDGSFSWSANNLTLDAADDIIFNKEVAMFGDATLDLNLTGNVIMNFDDNGDFAGKLNIASSALEPLRINGDPYNLITSQAELEAIADLSLDYALANDIELTGSFTPFSSFSGVLNGLGHTINNLSINDIDTGATSSGFIRTLSLGEIRNLGITNGTVSSTVSNVGGLVGQNQDGVIAYTFYRGSVTSPGSSVGGLVGFNQNATFTSADISNSYSIATVQGLQDVGGLVGLNTGDINFSFSIDGTVTATNTDNGAAGGLVGNHRSNISRTYSNNSVNGGIVGGLIGVATFTDTATIENSYSYGTVVGGAVSGGLIGEAIVTPVSSYWDTEASGVLTSDGGVGRTTAEMQKQATYTGWDFINNWKIDEDNSYPQFLYVLPVATPSNNVYWDGGNGDLNWASANNWNDNTLPAASSLVTIGSNIGTINVAATYSLSSLTTRSALNLTNAQLNISGTLSANEALNLNNSSIVANTANINNPLDLSLSSYIQATGISANDGVTSDATSYLQASSLAFAGSTNIGALGSSVTTITDNLVLSNLSAAAYIDNTSINLNLSGTVNGDLVLGNSGAMNIDASGITSSTGNVDLTAGDGLTLGGNIVSTAGDMSLNAIGITGASGNSIQAGILTISSTAAVGSLGTPVETQVNTLNLTSLGAAAYFDNTSASLSLSTGAVSSDLQVSNSGDIATSGVVNTGGDLSLTSDVGGITLGGNMTSSGAATLTATDATGGLINFAGNTLQANTLTLSTSSDIGASGSSVSTTTDSLMLSDLSAAAYIDNTSTNLNLSGTVNGDLVLSNSGAMTIGASGITSTIGDIDLTAGDGLTLDGNIISTAGDVSLNTVGITGTTGNSIQAGILTISSTATIGSLGTPVETQVNTLNLTNLGADAFIENTSANMAVSGTVNNDLSLSNTGDITLGGNLTSTTGNISLNSSTGSVAFGGNVLQASTLTLSASSDIGSSGSPVVTTADTLVLSNLGAAAYIDNTSTNLNLTGTVNGDLVLSNSGAMTTGASDVTSSTGDIDLTSGGTLTLGGNIVSTAGDVSLNTAGITGATGNSIQAGILTISSTATVGSLGTPVETQVNTINLTNLGAFAYIKNTSSNLILSGNLDDDLELTNSGGITLGGNLNGNNISLTSTNGSITGNTSNYIQSNSLVLVAQQSIGSDASNLKTQVDQLDFTATNGGVHLVNNDPGLGFMPAVFNVWGSAGNNVGIINYGELIVPVERALSAGGTVNLTANSPLTINGTVTAGGDLTLTAADPGDLTINGLVSTTNGFIFLNAPGGSVLGNIPSGAFINGVNPNSQVVPAENQVTANNTLEQVDSEGNTLVDNETYLAEEEISSLQIFLLEPDWIGKIYTDYLEDTFPPSGVSSGIPLPDVNEIGLVEALLELFRQEYTPEDRYRFYSSLTVEQVIEGLRQAKLFDLADFFLLLSENGLLKESDLMKILDDLGMTEEEKVAYLGVYVRMRQIAMEKILAPAIAMLRKDPNIPDVISEGQSGDDLISEILENYIQTDDGLVLLEGQVKSRSRLLNLRINDQWAFIDESGKYKVLIPVDKGSSQLSFVVNDPSGEADKKVLNVDSKQKGELKIDKGRRVALFIGVEEYDFALPELETPVKDIEDVSDRLKSSQLFEIQKLVNPSKSEVLDHLKKLSSELSDNDTLFVYYAGHGYLLKDNGRGYWLPRDASPQTPENWISNRDISRLFHRTRSKQILLVSDSCYSGAFVGSATILNNAKDYYGKPRAVMGLSSGGEQPVWDGGGDGNSIFAAKLLETLGQGQIVGESLYKQVKTRVVKESPQVPGYGAMLMPGYDDGGDFELK